MVPKKSSREIGYIGEELGCEFIKKLGYKVLTKNWYCHYGEIDIIARYLSRVVFFEVKYVTSTQFCYASELYTYSKRKHLHKTISYFVKKYPKIYDNWQLDLLCITATNKNIWIDHYKNLLI